MQPILHCVYRGARSKLLKFTSKELFWARVLLRPCCGRAAMGALSSAQVLHHPSSSPVQLSTAHDC